MLKIYSVSDRAIQIDWPMTSSNVPSSGQLATFPQALVKHGGSKHWPEFQIVQADCSVSIVFAKPPGGPFSIWDIVLQLESSLGMLNTRATKRILNARRHVVEVNYGGPAGQDLQWLAEQTGLGIEGVIDLHCSSVYTVEFLGFLPGFAYLSGLPKALHFPRRSSPRSRVPAGTLAIGAHYCAVYPWESPGGWHLLGHVEQVLFNPDHTDAQGQSLFKAGDTVQFVRAQYA
ncbi:5-oxoprolinase subunit B family protein [Limnobacter parvus]|uniref:Allophanate hydrolase subunit 1 n=1 Tax=Limnobacter parvus TaxID=2939690 RepID=A0ABT1XHU8_9BURK|nr:allophanate hydrolase subunit 1 [Limnobacter parvus]MCR2746860.1 allophanate hydrolase subunit 1 [Limnobacter parvus]